MDATAVLDHFSRTLPPADREARPTLKDAVRTALDAREAFPWCAALGEEDFLRFVACPRVNDEPLVPCRAFFARELAPRVAGLSWEQAVLAVNRWCAEHVTYRFNEAPTADALTVFRRGHGRCGEESVFAVHALRSVGVAARQVYAVWWAHCDDNHAWVEVFDGGAWHYLGACEPEPVLDRGWFTAAAARAVYIRWKDWDPAAPGGFWSRPVTDRYAPVSPLAVQVRDDAGRPVAGARVSFSLLNTGSLRELTAASTDEDGRVALSFGRGSVWVAASQGGLLAEALAQVGEASALSLTLAPPRESSWRTLRFAAPTESGTFQPPLSPAQRELRAAWRAEAAASRAEAASPAEPAPFQAPPVPPTGPARLTLLSPEASGVCTLARWEADRLVSLPVVSLSPGAPTELAIPAGCYRLMTALRLPSGDQLARERTLFLAEGRPRQETVPFPRASREELLIHWPLPAFSLGKQDGLALLKASPFTLLAWLEPAAEPSQHLVTELAPALSRLEQLGCGPVLSGVRPEDLPPALAALPCFPEADRDTVELLARRLYTDPGLLPLVVLADRRGAALFRSSGYRVGAVREVLAALEAALDFPGEIPYNEQEHTPSPGKET